MAYSPEGATLAVSCESSIILWNPKTGEEKEHLRDCPDYAPALAFTHDGSYLAIAGHFTTRLCSIQVRVDEDDRWSVIQNFSHLNSCSALAVSPDGRWVANCYDMVGRDPRPSFKLVAIR